MLAYQNGMPKSYLMAKVDELDKGPVAVAIVEKAYTFPRRDTATEQTKLAREYLEIWYEICVDALGGD